MRQRRFSSVLTCALLLLCGIYTPALLAQVQTVPRPTVIIPFMKKAPVIDGVITTGEYPTMHLANLVAGSSLALQRRQAEFWLGSDGKLIYLAIRTGVTPTYGPDYRSDPPPGKRDAGALFGGIFGLVWEDMVDFWIDNNAGAPAGKWYRVAVNPVGAIYDVVYDHVYNIPVNAWRVTMTQAHKVVNNVWTAEFAIDPASFQLPGLSTPFTMRVNRFFTHPGDYSHWENVTYSSDFPGMGVTSPETMPSVCFANTAPIVQEVSVQNTQGINLALDVTNPTAAALTVKVTLGYKQDGPAGYDNAVSTVTLNPGVTRRFTLKRPLAQASNYLADAYESVTSSDGATIYFLRDFKWNTNPSDAMWDNVTKKPDDPVAHYEIEFHPTAKVLRWRANISANANKLQIKQFRIRVVNTATNAVVTEQTTEAPANFDAHGQITFSSTAVLNPGRYAARLFLDTATPATTPAKEMVFNYATDFPWLNNTIGISTEVIPPFTPITVTGNTVGTVLRAHTMTTTGLWSQVVAKGAAILTGPMRFDVKQLGRLQPVRGQLTFSEKKGYRVVTNAQWSAGPLSGKTTSEYDYDGCMKVTLKLTQQPKTMVDSMELVIPISDAVAALFHENGDGLRYNEAGYVPKGTGIVWSSDKASKSLFVGTFIPYLWVGGEERGLCWFASNDKDWVVDETDKVPALALERNGATLNLRVRLIQKPTTLSRVHTIVFGLQATPTRPMPEQPSNWRSWGFGGSSTFNWQFAGMCNYYGCPYYSLRPLNNDYTIIQKVATSKKTGVRDDAFFTSYIAAHPEWTNEVNWASNPAHASVVVPYTNLRGDEKSTMDWVVYQDEWKANSFPVWNMFDGWGWERTADYTKDATSAASASIDFVVILPKSRRDYLLYMYKKFLENGFDGIYWDNTYIFANNNPISGDGYLRRDGQIQPSSDIWEMREVFKRTAVLLYQMGKPNANMAHSTNSYIVPMMSWVGYNLDWEWKYGPDDFQNRVARDYTRAATMGWQAGTVPAILDGVQTTAADTPRVERTRTGVLAVHELSSWNTDLPTTKYFWTLGYGTPDCQVYHYFDAKPAVTFTGLDAEFLLLQNNKLGKTALLVVDFGNGGSGTVKLDLTQLNLPGNFVAVNQENPTQKITASNGAFQIQINKHDYQLYELQKSTAPLTGLSMKLNPAAMGVEGKTTTITATATGGISPEYKFYAIYSDVGQSHTVTIRDYATSASFAWKPIQPATYTVYACVREKGTTVTYAFQTSVNNYVVQPALMVGRDVVYGQAQGYDGSTVNLLLDAYAPATTATQSRPVLMLIHGGGFGGGDKAQGLYMLMAEEFAKAGYVVFSINYRLLPNGMAYTSATLDKAVADATTAVDWIRANSTRYNLDPEKIFLAGDSAGGGAAVNTCYRNPAHIRAKGCIDLWGGLPKTATSDQNYPWSGPIYPPAVSAGTPPTCIIHGTGDTVVPYQTSVNLVAKLTAAGIYNELHPLTGANHYPENLAAQFIPMMITFANKYAFP